MGRLLSRGLRWCWFPIGKLRRSCIRYDRCRRRLVCGQPWIGKLTGLKHVVKAEPEEAAYEHADSKIVCDRYPSFFRPTMPFYDPCSQAKPRTCRSIGRRESLGEITPEPGYK
jgi:hypothetical protein